MLLIKDSLDGCSECICLFCFFKFCCNPSSMSNKDIQLHFKSIVPHYIVSLLSTNSATHLLQGGWFLLPFIIIFSFFLCFSFTLASLLLSTCLTWYILSLWGANVMIGLAGFSFCIHKGMACHWCIVRNFMYDEGSIFFLCFILISTKAGLLSCLITMWLFILSTQCSFEGKHLLLLSMFAHLFQLRCRVHNIGIACSTREWSMKLHCPNFHFNVKSLLISRCPYLPFS